MDDQAKTPPENPPQSLPLLMDHPDLLRVRVLPAEFARLLGVSKQTVSQWVKQGKLTINPLDGRLDVQAAIQQVLRNTDPGRLRARVLRQAVQDVQGLREEIARAHGEIESLVEELAKARDDAGWWERWANESDGECERFKALVIERESELRATADGDEWRETIRRIGSTAAVCDDTGDLLDTLDAEALEALV